MESKVKRHQRLKLLGIIGAAAFTVVAALVSIVYLQQDRVVGTILDKLNHDFEGRIEIADSHISPFKNFPYISVDLEDLMIYEDKSEYSEVLLQVSDAYVGFEIWDVISGDITIKKLRFDQGFLSLVQHTDGSFNIVNALSEATNEADSVETEEFHLDLKEIELVNVDLIKFNEANGILVEAFIDNATSGFSTSPESIEITLKASYVFNLLFEDNTSLFQNKHMTVNTTLSFENETHLLQIGKSEVGLEKALFVMEGSVDVDRDMYLDLEFHGKKPNFDLFLAFAPEELSPLLERYDNGGNIYFDAVIKGSSINGQNPKIDVDFGCEEAFVENTEAQKGVNDLYFEGHYTNGEKRDPTTMSLVIEDFRARPETGIFQGSVVVNNFESPDIEMQVKSEFDLDFLAKFLNLTDLRDITGDVSLEMNFHDIIDLDRPETAIEKLNESYFTELKVRNLNFTSTEYPLPVKNVNIQATMDGHRANIDQLDFQVGGSDLSISATVSDLPAILHHTDQPVEALLDIKSTLIDLQELTSASGDSTITNEKVKDVSLKFKFVTSARAFTESPNLPTGEFFIEQLHAQFTNYPHELHDFNADVLISDSDFKVIDFTGMIDKSDFHFKGNLENYDLWFADTPVGHTRVDFNITSSLIQLEDLFSYGGENYVPEDYRHEEFKALKLHGVADMVFDSTLVQTDITIDELAANMKAHPMRFEKFNGKFTLDSDKFRVTDLAGKLGNSDFVANMVYYYSPDSITPPHEFNLKSTRLDFDQLFAYTPPEAPLTPEEHEAGFNIFSLPFSNMNFGIDIDHLNYHRIKIDEFSMHGRMQENHYVYLDSMAMNTAGGSLSLNGYFNGSDPQAIYFSPAITLEHIDLDQLLFKFENFGQDHLVSENLHGKLSGTITGKVHMHADMVPIIDDSDLHMEISVNNGSLNHYAAFDALSDYFGDKNLDNVRFDTLQNALDLAHGELSIPSMRISSTLGYFEISGVQHTDMSMEYYLRVPWKVVTKAGIQKLFGKKERDTSEQEDDIQYKTKNMKFLNLKITGTPDEYAISLGKNLER